MEFYGLHTAILYACRQTYAEAAAVLYGCNLFFFDCASHHGACFKATNPKCTCVQQSDLTLIYTWLSLIGIHSRRLLRRIKIMVRNPAFLYYEGEPRLQFKSDEVQTDAAGWFLGKAFSLLGSGHALNQIKVVFKGEHAEELPEHLFHNGLNSELLAQLASIKGIKELKISPSPRSKQGLEALKDIKAQMEIGNGEKRLLITPRSTLTDGVASAQQLGARMMDLTKEWQELEDRLVGTQWRIREIKGMLAGAEKAIR